MHALSVASEAFPLVKTGGLADVVGALSGALRSHGVTVTTLMPAYPAVLASLQGGETLHRYSNLLGLDAQLLASNVGGSSYLLLDAPALFSRGGGLYQGPDGKDWPDNWRRFAALGRVAADLASGVIAGHNYEILHAHDWQGAMAPAYLKYAPGPGPRAASVMTIHNIAYQGHFDSSIFGRLGLPEHAFSISGVEYYGGVGFLKAGLASADKITTVSPTYAREIHEPAFGMGLDGLIRARTHDVLGILNGIDTQVWNPSTDPQLKATYDSATLHRRSQNRDAIEEIFALEREQGPLFTIVSRLTWQKGMDVMVTQLDRLVEQGGRLALLGTGEKEIELEFQRAALRHPGRIGVQIAYDEGLSHLLQGGADAILLPSRYEPCGLTQLHGLAYGCIPVANRTGGLADTIIDATAENLASGLATGILFDAVTPQNIVHAIRRTVERFSRSDLWLQLQRQGMAADFSWTKSALRYAQLYRQLSQTPPRQP